MSEEYYPKPPKMLTVCAEEYERIVQENKMLDKEKRRALLHEKIVDEYQKNIVPGFRERAEKAEQERDEARRQVDERTKQLESWTQKCFDCKQFDHADKLAAKEIELAEMRKLKISAEEILHDYGRRHYKDLAAKDARIAVLTDALKVLDAAVLTGEAFGQKCYAIFENDYNKVKQAISGKESGDDDN